MMGMKAISLEYPTDWTDYQLLDSGLGQKLERFGPMRVSRTDPRAIWNPGLPKPEWDQADGKFVSEGEDGGHWKFRTPAPNPWLVRYHRLVFSLRPTEFKHLGLFPEQAVNWNWLQAVIAHRPLKILNLFAYTGGATIASALAGARTTHVDSARGAIAWAKINAKASELPAKAIRWIEDDAYKFVCREGRRGGQYDGIMMDPPRFGRGAKGEVWKLADDLPKLLAACKLILSPQPKFFLINAYTADLSSIVIGRLLEDLMQPYHGKASFGELALQDSAGGHLLPSGLFARWQKDAGISV